MSKFVITDEELKKEIKEAKSVGKRAYETEPRAVTVKYNKKTGRVIVDLITGVSFMFPAAMAEELANLPAAVLSDVKILADGIAIYWEKADVALSVPDLLNGIFGSKSWMNKLRNNLNQEAKLASN